MVLWVCFLKAATLQLLAFTRPKTFSTSIAKPAILTCVWSVFSSLYMWTNWQLVQSRSGLAFTSRASRSIQYPMISSWFKADSLRDLAKMMLVNSTSMASKTKEKSSSTNNTLASTLLFTLESWSGRKFKAHGTFKALLTNSNSICLD